MQPDTLIPDPVNPQAWNRFSYVLNNPVRYNDPTGHSICGLSGSGACDKDEEFVAYAHEELGRRGGKDDLGAMIRIVNKAAKLYHSYDLMIPALSGVFLGIKESNSWTVYNAAFNNPNPCTAIGRPECNPTNVFNDEGFHEDFQDNASQPFHFWAYLATAANTEGTGPASYIPGRSIGDFANNFHEIYAPLWGKLLNKKDSGASWQDYVLGRAGVDIGTLVNIGAVPPDQLGNTIREYVGNDGPGAFYVNPLIYIAPLDGNRP